MVFNNFNNWFKWSYNNVLYSKRESNNDVYNYHIDLTNVEDFKLSYHDALKKNSQYMRDQYSEPFDVLLSGGIDSEVVVRSFKMAGITHNTYIFKYEDDLNLRDVNSAIDICKNLNINYKIINFNLKKFFENDALEVFEKSKCIRAARLTHLKFTDLVDNIPVMGEAEPYWKRVEGKDYSKKSKWLFPLNESNHNASMYCYHNNRSSICDWYEFHPCVIKAYNKLPLVRSLINDELPGKLSNWTSRISIHKEIWPYIENKIKLTGYEGSGFPGQQPDYMNRMQDYIISKIGTGTEYWLTDCELQFIF